MTGHSNLKGMIMMLNEFPVIHTNIWDAIWAVPVILVIILLFKIFKLPTSWVSTVATVSGLLLSIFISHRGNLSAGIFMGIFYGAAAVGTIYSVKASYLAFREL